MAKTADVGSAAGRAARKEPGSRAAWGTISRDQIVELATKVVATDGVDQLTIRSLAADLGVAPMSIYRHVRDKDDLLDDVVDRLLTDRWQPQQSRRSWRKWTIEAADRLREFLVTQPAALHIYLHHPVTTPAALARMEAMTAVLRRAVGDPDQARRAYAAIHTYTLGFAALEAGRKHTPSTVYSDTAAGHQLAAYTSVHQFRDGLGYLLDGIVAQG